MAFALPTLTEMKDRVYARLRDSEKAFVLDDSVADWLNEAYLDLNARLRIKRAEVSATSAADGTITAPADMVEIVSLWFGTTPVVFVDDTTFNWYQNTQNNTGLQIMVRIVGETLETYPAQVSKSYTLEYVDRVDEMTNGTATPSALTPELAMRLPWYAVAEAKYQEGEFIEAERYMAMYVEGLPGRPRGMYRLRPAPLNLTVEAGPFDRDF